MFRLKFQNPRFTARNVIFNRNSRLLLAIILFFGFSFIAFSSAQKNSAQNAAKAENLPPTLFRVGERLTYNVSFEKINNAAFAELYVVSRGKLGEKDAVELHSKIKTTDLVSSAFYFVDEQRTTFAAADTGVPLYIRKTSNAGVLPVEKIYNYLVSPAATNDLLTFIYQARNAGGVGAFTFQEDGKIYGATLQTTAAERVKTDAGNFESSLSTVQSQYLTDKGISDLRINFSADAAKIPVLIRFKTAKGDFRAELASLQTVEPAPIAEPAPPPIQQQQPPPQKTPLPIQTPTPYVENQPLLPDLSFELGETLEYQVSVPAKYLGNVTLQARERKQFAGQDSLLLTATVTGSQAGNPLLNLNDFIRAQVNPDTLAPQQIDIKTSGSYLYGAYSQVAQFDQRNGFVAFNGANRTAIPVGTHSILSLVYAVRSFNLKPSKDANNPVNDTRVAVFLGSESYVFTLRPSAADIINLKGEKIAAQLVSISTGNPTIDQLNIRLWLSTDEKRLPLRLIIGNFQADLISETKVSPK